jgi:hypothetical protein
MNKLCTTIVIAAVAGMSADVHAQNAERRVLTVHAYTSEIPVETVAPRTYFTAAGVSHEELLAFRRDLIARGARHVNLFLPDVIVCELPAGLDVSAIPGAQRVVRREEQAFGPFLAPGLSSRESMIKMCYERVDEMRRDRKESPRYSSPVVEGGFKDAVVVLEPETVRETSRLMKSSGFFSADDLEIGQTSEFFGGDILVQMVLPESNGEYEAETENWSDSELSEALSAAYAGMLDVQATFPSMPMHLVFKPYRRAETGYEPIKHAMGDDENWLRDVIHRLDPTLLGKDLLLLLHGFNVKNQRAMGTDFVFTAFFANSENAPNHMFHGAFYTAYAMLGGPYNITPFPAGRDPNKIGRWLLFCQIFKHETAHIFWALDEYASADGPCTEKSGYLDYENLNKLTEDPDGNVTVCARNGPFDCLMQNAAREDLGGPWCRWTQGQIGVIDDDGNSIPDIFESSPLIEFATAEVETVETSRAVVELTAVSTPVPNRNSKQPDDSRVDYAVPLKSGKYRMVGGEERSFSPADGRWDEAVEECAITITGLPAGVFSMTFQVKNAVGYWSGKFTKKLYFVGVNYAQFQAASEPERVRVRWNVINEKFGATFDVHRLDPGETMPGRVIATQVQPSGVTTNGVTPYEVVDGDVTPGQDYRYYVTGHFTLDLGGDHKKYTSISELVRTTAMVPVPSGSMISNAAPNPFRYETTVSVIVPETYSEYQVEGARGGAGSFVTRVPTAFESAVYDVAGREVKTLRVDSVFDDVITLKWDGTDSTGRSVPSGVYFIRAKAGDALGVRKVLLIR